MKNIFLSIAAFLMSAIATSQTMQPDAPNKAPIAIAHSSPVSYTPCAGSYTPKSVDLKWKPILNKRQVESENDGPDEKLLDSIKAYKMKLKNDYESKNGIGAIKQKTTTVLPVVGTNFSGYTPNGFTPLDNSIAISNSGLVISVENSLISYYNTSGSLLFQSSMESMLSAVFSSLYNVCDPVILYDPGHDRFIFFAQEIGTSGIFSNNRMFVCFSKSNNPLVDGWWYYSIAGDPTGSNDGFDYPKLAVNDSELFITGNMFSMPSRIFHQSIIRQIDKLAGFSGASIGGVYYSSISGSPSTILPVSWGQNADILTTMILVSTSPLGGSAIKYYKIVGNWCCSPTITYYSIPTTPYAPATSAHQLGTTTNLSTGDCRALSGFYLNGIIHFVFNCDYSGGYCGINYNRLDLSTLTNTSLLGGAAGYDFAYPSIASFATTITDKSVMIGFGLTSSTMYPKIGVINCDDAMTWSAYSTVYSSPTYIQYGISDTLDRWGDYTGMARYHTSTTPCVWMSGMRSNSSNYWQTWIAQIGGLSTPSCAVPTGLSATSITMTSALLNWSVASGASSYNIRYRQVGSTTWSTTTSTGTSVTVTGLLPATDYEFQVQTICVGTGVTAYSGSGTFTTLAPPCNVPSALTTITLTSATAYVSWGSVTGAVSYNIQYRQVGTVSWSMTTSAINSVTITGLLPGTDYEFEVQSVCAIGSSAYSSSSYFTTENGLTVGGQAQTLSKERVYPNPIDKSFSVEFTLSQDETITISVLGYDGKVVKELYNGLVTAGENVFSFDKSNLTSGIYFLVIKSPTQTFRNEKIVVNQ